MTEAPHVDPARGDRPGIRPFQLARESAWLFLRQLSRPASSGVSNLRVINEDRMAPGGGFATHGHQEMGVLTYLLDGASEHRDRLGNGAVIRPGDVQYMSAATGVRHSEYDASQAEPVHLLQIWLTRN